MGAEPQPSEADVRVVDNPDELRYELELDGRRVGSLAYRREPEAVVLVHTDVEPSLEGRGLGSRLVGAALDDLRARGRRIVPVCPFVTAYLRRHPEYADLVAEET